MPNTTTPYSVFSEEVAVRLAKATPSAKSDPFYAKRHLTHFLNGVDDPQKAMKGLRELEGRAKAERLAKDRDPDIRRKVEEVCNALGLRIRGHYSNGRRSTATGRQRRPNRLYEPRAAA